MEYDLNRMTKAMAKKSETPKVGVGVVIRRGHEVLLGLRKGSHGEGEWSLPGGHLDLAEEFLPCCIREVKEETDIDITDVTPLTFTNHIFWREGLHYVTLFFVAHWDITQKPKLMEPDKCEEWRFFRPENLPENLFPVLKSLLVSPLFV